MNSRTHFPRASKWKRPNKARPCVFCNARAMISKFFSPFYHRGRLDRILLAIYLLINALVLINALLHNPYNGYDAHDHINYIEALASHWRLPTKAETGQYYSPPLPYILPAILTAAQIGLWKAVKLAQLINVLLAMGLTYYLLKICDLIGPENSHLKIASIGMLGILPVFYRSFSLIRGEPYLAFLAVYITHRTLLIFLKKEITTFNVIMLGITLGMAILARQWGFFLFPPILIFAAWANYSGRETSLRRIAVVISSFIIAFLVGGWFYALIYKQYGTLTAFDRKPQKLSAEHLSALFAFDESSEKLFTDPVRTSLSNHFFPIFYADTWGDYWGYFLIYAKDTYTGQFNDGIVFQNLTRTTPLAENMVTNRFTINSYLGIANLVSLIPSIVSLSGLVYGLLLFIRLIAKKTTSDLDHATALFAMISGATAAGYGWFLIRYQSAVQSGDLIKSTYLLQIFPFLALLAGIVLERVRERWPKWWLGLMAMLSVVFLVDLPAMFTRYTYFTSSPTTVGFMISTIAFIAGIIIIYWLHNQYHLDIIVEPVSPPPNPALISICVPARDEEKNIRACIEAILAQTYPNFEVIVVDDRSTDATPEILRGFAAQDDRLKVISGSDLPSGWAGKPHALYQAAAAARGQWLCFVDADTFLTPAALTSCYVKALETRADLFTIMTYQLTETFWEKAVMQIVLTALTVGFPPRRVNDPGRRDAIANGQFILIKRKVYDAIGGHEAIQDQIVEDKAIAEKFKWTRFRLVVADGMQVARTRMYTALSEMWEGWTKNIYLGLRDRPALLSLGAFGAFLSVAAALFLPVWPVLGLIWLLNGGGWMAMTVVVKALTLWGVLLYARAAVAHRMGISRWYALTTPLGAGVFAAMMLVSTWKVMSGRGVTWRGRKYLPPRR